MWSPGAMSPRLPRERHAKDKVNAAASGPPHSAPAIGGPAMAAGPSRRGKRP